MSRSVATACGGASGPVGAPRARCGPASRPLLRLVPLALAPLLAFAPPARAEPPPSVQGYRIDDWKALSSDSLIIRTNDGRRYRATLMGKCLGLRFTDTIAFVTRGERSVDRYAGIMLPDGSRCYFKTFEAISQPTDVPAGKAVAPRGGEPAR